MRERISSKGGDIRLTFSNEEIGKKEGRLPEKLGREAESFSPSKKK